MGWINKKEFGCIMKGFRTSYNGWTLPKKRIFSSPFRNFGRLNNISKLTCFAIALALNDAGMDFSVNRKRNIGIISTGASGSFQTDMIYFKDYLDSGRTLSRGNLFIYTLPSSPSGEAAIYFGLRGPLFYISSPYNSMKKAVTTASEIIYFDQVHAMLAGMSEEGCAAYFVLKKSKSSRGSLCDLEQAVRILNGNPAFDEMIEEFTYLKRGDIIQ